MSELRDLYQEVILDHSKHPRNHRKPADASQQAQGYNPLCGDRLTLYLRIDGDRIEDIAFEGSGCAISTASASMMTECLKGKTTQQAEQLLGTFHAMLTGTDEPDWATLDKLAVFAGVREFPVRVKCATLAWHTLRAALEQQQEVVTTE